MDIQLRMLLLKLLNENGNIENLEKAGYSYPFIAKVYSQLINEELIIPNETLHFMLSKKGVVELEMLKEEIIRSGKWKIEPFTKYKVNRMKKYDIFIE